jgi:hypothetical protein
VRRGAVNTPTLDAVARTLTVVRGLPFRAEVPARVLDDAQVSALIAGELEREFRPGDLDRLTAIYARLGFLSPSTPLGPAVQALLSDQIAALYDPRTKSLALTAGGLRQQTFTLRVIEILTGRDLLGEVLVAHELTHALQDQHFGLPTSTPPMTNANGDRALARRALVEGDASLASVAYARGGQLDAPTVERFVEEVAAVPEELRERHPEVPEVLRSGLAFQYNTGSNFTARAYLAGGWKAVDDAHRDPPVSTEQVLHPEKYFGARDQPATIALGGTEGLERRGWQRILEDTFGELDLRVLAGRAFDPADAADIAAGWGGDRCRALGHGDELAIVWLTTWDTPADAVRFETAIPVLIEGAHVERRDASVLIVVAPEPERLAAQVWARSRITRGA